ncbi:conserved hypothetical protein [Thermoanaerobacter italicus Ab9]|uniref:Uncharacterized protein n=1 Tax=Thermoanaerobacter italicus (strain DSM 9252 / Ab9) TaxID=580331 RepID=D3T4H4_THEIA|nr:hypothetical protein [Thermoanaerobacter italicus]ADD03126.1 conserved hypothetical protein [Thermoanaerobacter italicus Ab9]
MLDIYRALENYKNDRVDEIVNHIAATSSEYKQLTCSVKIAYGKIFSSSTNDSKSWLEKYEDLVGQREALVFRFLYQQGFKDGLKIGFLLNNAIFKDENKNVTRFF